jgi:hypothetical protein
MRFYMLFAVIALTALLQLNYGCQQKDASSKAPTAPVEVKAAGWVTELADHLKWENQIDSYVAQEHGMEQPKLYTVVLDEVGDPVPLRDLMQGDTLLCAAEMYAVTTLDFDVRVGEVIEAGFYPFLDLPESVTEDMAIIQNGNKKETFTSEFLNTVGTSAWNIDVKNIVLSNYYTVCFLAHCVGCSSDETGIPDDYIATIPRNPAFWINPVTEQPMTESNQVGDFRVVDRTGFLSSMILTMIEQSTTTKKFICINNEWDSRQLLSKTPSGNEPEFCCFIGERAYSVAGGAEQSTTYIVRCESTGAEVTCEIKWKFTEQTTRIDRRVLVAKCSDRPHWAGYRILPLPCPVNGPVYSDIAHFGQAAQIIPTTCPVLSCPEEPVEVPDHDDIIASLTNQTHERTFISGPMYCDCPEEEV